ncbi:pulmonary surfactant-associated protein D-like [Drosophila innubila]|uniref:pulmonary surfactant-associated protein D-like n=1 Tax=Drosophila innubila TaxID=198719 RepID=UPI00148BF852|nr:pulmonary surfactant-associated protein D-like [Drosophila innubila]
MKIILFGLLVAILAVQEQAALSLRPNNRHMWESRSSPIIRHPTFTTFDYEEMPVAEVKLLPEANVDSAEDSKKLVDEKLDKLSQKFDALQEKFVKSDEKFGKLEKKLELLGKTFTAIRAKPSPKFEKIGSKYYYIDDSESVNWFEAAHKCRALGGNLAGLQSEQEFKAVSEKLTNEHYWLDINDLGTEGVFKLLSTGKEAPYLYWRYPEPNNKGGNENCVQVLRVDSKYAMNDNSCDFKFNFICEKNTLE